MANYSSPKKKGITSQAFLGSSVFDAATPVSRLVAQAPGGTVRRKSSSSTSTKTHKSLKGYKEKHHTK